MASEAQIAANRRNAMRSTGPRSEAGKARVAQNGLKHGLCSARVLLPDEDPAELEALVEDLKACFRPATEMELALLRQYAAATWRLGRIPALEAGMLEAGWPEGEAPDDLHPDAWGMGRAFIASGKEIARLSLHESRLSRERERARKELEALQAARREREREAEAELALDSQRDCLPLLREKVDGAQRRPGEGQGAAWTSSPGSPQRPGPHPDPLPQERERDQDQALTPELALLSRNAA